MHQTRFLVLALIIFLLLSTVSCTGTTKSETIEIKEQEGVYELTVPVSRLILTIPKGGLVQGKNTQGGGADNPRYFFFEDKSFNLVISGWFESEQRFPGVKESWADDTKKWKRDVRLPEPQNVSFERIGDWDTIIYDMPYPDVNNSHIRANWVQAETWIDIHLSITSNRPNQEIRANLQDILKAIQVKEKKTR